MWVSEWFLIISSAGPIDAVYKLLDWNWSNVPNKSSESLEWLWWENRAWDRWAGWCTRCMLRFSPLAWDCQLINQMISYATVVILRSKQLQFLTWILNPKYILIWNIIYTVYMYLTHKWSSADTKSRKRNFTCVKVTGVCHMVELIILRKGKGLGGSNCD